ncbi:hypothetical protein [Leifsonia shinshuensis]
MPIRSLIEEDSLVPIAFDDRGLRAATMPVEAVIPRDDEVVSVAETRAAARRMNWREVIVDGAHFPATADHAEQRWRSLVAAVTRD